MNAEQALQAAESTAEIVVAENERLRERAEAAEAQRDSWAAFARREELARHAAEAQRDTLAEAASIACELLAALQPWSLLPDHVRSPCVRLTVKLASVPDEALAGVAPPEEQP